MNQQCKVCGEPAAGFHFGAFTCEGCKSFFGRTYNNLGSITECKNGGVCVINKKNRTACKACRLRKCLMVGMSKSGSRYGRRSNWFKIHCLLQEQTNGSPNLPLHPIVGPPFGPNFLSGFLPQSNAQTVSPFGKDAKESSSISQEELAMQSHLLTVTMLKQEHDRVTKSPHPDDVALQNQLRLLAWQKERERISTNQQSPKTPPRESTPTSFGNNKHKSLRSPAYPVNYAQKELVVVPSSPEVFRPYLPTYKRSTDSPSDSGTSSGEGADGLHEASSRSNSALSYFNKSATSPTLSEREFPPRKINATVTFTTGYHSHQGLGLMYPPPGLVTPAMSQTSPRGGDLLLVSPSPGGLAIEQEEPIDLSIRSSRTSPRPSHSTEEEEEDDENRSVASEHDSSSRRKEELPTKSKPLDLTLGVKRPAELPLSL